MKVRSKNVVCYVAVLCASLTGGSLFAKDTVGQKVDKAINKAEEKVDTAKKEAEKARDKAKEKAENARDKAKEKVKDAADRL